MNFERAELFQLEVPMVEPLAAAHGALEKRKLVLIRIDSDDGTGWGECVALNDASYNGEWSDGAYEALRDVYLPQLVTGMAVARSGFPTALAAIEMAQADIELKRLGRSLAAVIGSTAASVEVCAVIGLASLPRTVQLALAHAADGFRHLKLKVQPLHDIAWVDAVRKELPHMHVRVDANGSYDWGKLEDRQALIRLTEMGVTAVEQPFAVADKTSLLVARNELPTMPIALDESVMSVEAGLSLVEQRLADVIAIKPGNLGGLSDARRLARAVAAAKLQASLGGMVDGGLSRAVNLALAATPEFTHQPAEISPDGRWFADSFTTEPVRMVDGKIAVPDQPGIGATVNQEVVQRYTLRSELLRR